MLTQSQIDQLVTDSRAADEGPSAFARRVEAAVRGEIADAWEGCLTEADAHGTVDVGASIRAGKLVDA